MCTRTLILALALCNLSGCLMIPESKSYETLTFDNPPPSQEPVSYADLMCCYQCAV